jgi:hypothetical protein
MQCPKCKHKLVSEARFCHHCGLELPPDTAVRTSEWYYEPVFVLLTIFLVLAIFGLPLLWKSPRFSPTQKVLVSLATVIYTGIIIWLIYYLVAVIFLPYYNQMKNLL